MVRRLELLEAEQAAAVMRSLPDSTLAAGPPPVRFQVVPRERLFAALDRGVELPLVLVVAPPGSGKTVLVSEWARERSPYPVAWLSIDTADAAGPRFWPALMAALCSSPGVPVDSSLHGLKPPPTGVDLGFVRALVAGLEDLPAPLVLVIDDLHLIGSLAALETLDALAARLPAQVRLILCSRHDPPLSIHRMRVQGTLVEIRATELTFDLDEMRSLFAGEGVDLSNEQLVSVWQRTEGWAAAVRLAALSLKRAADPDAFIRDFSGNDRVVADYLAEQVLRAEPPDVREFLLRTSLPDRISGDLADALTGESGGQEALLELERENLLITGLDARRIWFRYHPLLAELLRSQLASGRPDEVVGLHRRAARWFAANELVQEALEHAIHGADWDLATEVVGDHWLTMFMDGDGGPIVDALARLPDEVLTTSPELTVATAMRLLLEDGAFDSAEAHLRHAAENADAVPPARRARFERSLALARLYLARMRGEARDTASALALLSGPDTGRGEECSLAAAALLNVGQVTLFSDNGGAPRAALEDAVDLARLSGRDFVVLSALGGLTTLETADGHLSRAAGLAEEALAIAQRRGWTELTLMAPIYGALSMIAHDRSDCGSAQAWLDRCRGAVADDPDPMHAVVLALAETRRAIADANYETALRYLRRCSRELDRWAEPSWMARISVGLLLRVLVDAAKPEEARRILAELGAAGEERLEVSLAVARLALADGDPQRALAALEGAQPPLRAAHLFTIDAALVGALAYEQLPDTAAAAAAVEGALDLAEVEGIIQPILEFGSSAGRLLGYAIRHGTAHRALVDELLDRLNGGAPAPAVAALREPLTEREVEVLRYLPTSMSGPEIADELFLSPNTIKTHQHHIYAKLGVHRRNEAVRRARQLRLLGGTLHHPALNT